MKCGGCGKRLRTPVSVARGLGPVCWARLTEEQRAAIETPAPAVRAPVVVPVAPCDDQLALTIPEPLPLETR